MTAVELSSAIAHPGHLYVGGDWVEPSTSRSFDVIGAATEETLYRVAEAGDADIDRAVAAARVAFDAGLWPRLTHAERAGYLRAIAAAINERAGTLADIWSSETGIVNTVARVLIAGAAGTYDYYAGLADDYPFVERHVPTGGGAVGLLVREPVGVVGAIIPWNGPMPLMALKAAPALLAGCTLVIKSSPEAPGAGCVFAEIAESVGLPAGVVNVVTADRDVSELLVRDSRVDKVSFTGSTVAGRQIAALMGDRVGRCTLELGGKSAAVVLDDADLPATALSLGRSIAVMTGQACAALTRVIVSRDRHDALVEALTGTMATVTIGDPFDPGTQMGPLATSRQRDRVERYVATGTADGARLAFGGGRPAGLDRGFYVEPTVFAGVSNSSTIAREEIFGPVLSVIAADDEDDAVAIANDSPFGLNASVYTSDPERVWQVARRLRTGTVGHNAPRADFAIAFGGFKQSGIGREGGREGLLPYLETKTVILDAEPDGVPSR